MRLPDIYAVILLILNASNLTIWPYKLKVFQAMRLLHKMRTIKAVLHIENQTVKHSEVASHSGLASFSTDF